MLNDICCITTLENNSIYMSSLLDITGATHKLKTLKMIMSTGSPLKPQSYDYVYREIKKDLLLASISGMVHTQGSYPEGRNGEVQCV